MEPLIGIAIGLVLLAILSWGIHYSITAPRKNREEDEENLDRKSSITQHAQGNPVQRQPDPKLAEERRRNDFKNQNRNRKRNPDNDRDLDREHEI